MNATNNEIILSRAKASVLARDFEQAIRLYKTLLRSDETNSEYMLQLASVYVRAGDDEKALSAYQDVLFLDSVNFDALISLGGIYRRLKRYPESIAVLERALTTGINPNIVYYNLGFTYKFMGNYDDAADCFDTVIESNPNDVLAYNHLGSIYAKRGEHQKAIATYQRGLKIDPNHPILHYNAAQSYLALKKYDDAKESFESALRSKPGWLDAMNGYADLLMLKKKNNEAREILTQATKLNPDDPALLNRLGHANINIGNYGEAEVHFEKAMEIDDKNSDAAAGLAYTYEKENRIDDASTMLDRALYLEPEANNHREQYASMLLKKGKLDQALCKIQDILEKDENDVQGLNLKGQYFIRRDDDAKADDCFKKITMLKPSYRDWIRDSGIVYHELGKYPAAEERLLKYLESTPDDADTLTVLASNYETLGKYKDALTVYKLASKYDSENQTLTDAIDRISSQFDAGNLPESEETFKGFNYNTTEEQTNENETAIPAELTLPHMAATASKIDDMIPINEDGFDSSDFQKDDSDFFEKVFDSEFDASSNLISPDGNPYPDNSDNLDVDNSTNDSTSDADEVPSMDSLIEQDAPIDYNPDTEPHNKFMSQDSNTLEDEEQEAAEYIEVEGTGFADEDLDGMDDIKNEVEKKMKPAYTTIPKRPPLPTSDEDIEEPLDIDPKEYTRVPVKPVQPSERFVSSPKNEQPLTSEIEPEAFEDLPAPEPEIEEEIEKTGEPEEQIEEIPEENILLTEEEPETEEAEPDDTEHETDNGQDSVETEPEAAEPAETEPETPPANYFDLNTIPSNPSTEIARMLVFIRNLSEFLPAAALETFLASRMCVQLDYVISCLLGGKGLLAKAVDSNPANNSETTPDAHENSLQTEKDDMISASEIIETLGYMRTLIFELPDKYRAAALDADVADIVETLSQKLNASCNSTGKTGLSNKTVSDGSSNDIEKQDN